MSQPPQESALNGNSVDNQVFADVNVFSCSYADKDGNLKPVNLPDRGVFSTANKSSKSEIASPNVSKARYLNIAKQAEALRKISNNSTSEYEHTAEILLRKMEVARNRSPSSASDGNVSMGYSDGSDSEDSDAADPEDLQTFRSLLARERRKNPTMKKNRSLPTAVDSPVKTYASAARVGNGERPPLKRTLLCRLQKPSSIPEVLAAFEDANLDGDIEGIQLINRKSVLEITLTSDAAKLKLLESGLNIKNYHHRFQQSTKDRTFVKRTHVSVFGLPLEAKSLPLATLLEEMGYGKAFRTKPVMRYTPKNKTPYYSGILVAVLENLEKPIPEFIYIKGHRVRTMYTKSENIDTFVHHEPEDPSSSVANINAIDTMVTEPSTEVPVHRNINIENQISIMVQQEAEIATPPAVSESIRGVLDDMAGDGDVADNIPKIRSGENDASVDAAAKESNASISCVDQAAVENVAMEAIDSENVEKNPKRKISIRSELSLNIIEDKKKKVEVELKLLPNVETNVNDPKSAFSKKIPKDIRGNLIGQLLKLRYRNLKMENNLEVESLIVEKDPVLRKEIKNAWKNSMTIKPNTLVELINKQYRRYCDQFKISLDDVRV